jgi:multidrug resistance efflux pump
MSAQHVYALEANLETVNAAREAAEAQVKRLRAETIEECAKKLQRWKRRDHLSLHAGEVTAQEFRTVVAVLLAIEGEFRALADANTQGGEGDAD